MDYQLALDAVLASAMEADGPEPFEDAIPLLGALLGEHPVEEMAYARFLREVATARVAALVGEDPSGAGRIVLAVEEMLRVNARDDFDSYMLYMEWGREPEKRFYQPRRHVLLPLVGDLQDLADGRLDFLSISLPPRVGKSTMCIFFLTWVMGRHPRRANVMSGHSDKLTKGFHREALGIITDDNTYRFARVFPGSPLVGSSFADETIQLRGSSERFPTLTCRSVDGTLTGAVEVGRDALLYCDDLVSDREEALSADRMDKLYSAYLNQLKDRKLDGARELHVGTRWVPNDVIGRIEEQYEGDPRYRFVTLPALGEDGETNFTYDYGLGFSTRYYEDMRASLVENGEGDSWDAKYMGKPVWIGGLMFARDELRLYDGGLPRGEDGQPLEPDGVIAVCDTKDRGADYACLPVAYVYGRDYYVHDVICDNSLPEVVEPRIVSALVRNDVGVARFESNSAGGRVADDIAEECGRQGHSIAISKKFSTENKETRIITDSMWIKEHCVFRSDEPSADYRRFMSMLTHYTTEGKNKHDDAPDAMSMLKRYATSLTRARVEAVRRIA